MSKVTERTKVPTLKEYADLRALDQLAAFELLNARAELRLAKARRNRHRALLTDAAIHKLRAQRTHLYTAAECAQRLELATQERLGKL